MTTRSLKVLCLPHTMRPLLHGRYVVVGLCRMGPSCSRAQERFGVPYSLCGCLPPLKAVNVTSWGGLFSRNGKTKVEVFANPRPDLVSTEDMNAMETHPSDHNAIVMLNPSNEARSAEKTQRKEIDKRSQEIAKAISKSKTDRWAELQQKRHHEKHELSFLCPVNWDSQ